MKLHNLLFLLLIIGIAESLPAQVVINEVCSDNGSVISDEDDDHPDWIELYNSGTSALSLSGCSLSDKSDTKWFFPDISIQDGEYLVVFASGKDRKGTVLHTSFKLSKEGEIIRLFDPSGNQTDNIETGYLQLDHSFGRSPDASPDHLGIFDRPTPGASNDSSAACSGYAARPVFSKEAGFYPQRILLSVTAGSPADIIHFTTDGSRPGISSPVYTSPLQLDSSTVVRALAISSNSSILPSDIVTNSYFTDYTSELPVISISTDPANLWDWNTGIYVMGPNASPVYPYFGANFWQDWEKLSHIEFFETNHKRILEQDAGLSINGGSVSRTRPQQSFRLTARDKYGSADFNYRFFEEKEIDHFKILVLRNSSGDFNKTHFRDGSLHKLMLNHVDVDLLCYRPAAIFLNGKYWGVLNIREKFSKFYLEENYGIDPGNIDLLEEDSTLIQGDFTAFNAMHDFITGNDLSIPANYDSASRMLDIESFCDYIIAETFLSNIDWPYNNIKYWRVRAAGSKWRYLLMDLDISLGNYGWAPASMDILSRLLGPYGDRNRHVQMLRSLLQNPDFRDYFINRYADLVNTLFTTDHMKAHIAKVKETLEAEMPKHFSRWGNSMQTWNDEINNVVMPYIDERPGVALQNIEDYFGLQKQVSVELEAWPPGAGYVKINTIEPELPWTGTYFDGVPLTLTAFPNPGFTFSSWIAGPVRLPEPKQSILKVNLETDNRFTACFGTETEQDKLVLYPNPAKETLNVSFLLQNASEGSIGIYSVQGKEIRKEEDLSFISGSNIKHIDISGLSGGVYIVRVVSGEHSRMAKVVILN